jgi:hypothetical protein
VSSPNRQDCKCNWCSLKRLQLSASLSPAFPECHTRSWRFRLGADCPVLAYMLMFVPWRLARMVVFFHPERDLQGIGLHINQSLIAVGTGGLAGLGLIEGKQKLFYPARAAYRFHLCRNFRRVGTDWRGARRPLFFIFAWRGLRTSLRARRSFWPLPRGGRDYHNRGADLLQHQRGAGPAADQRYSTPVYFLWGSSLFVMLASVGVLLNVSQQTKVGMAHPLIKWISRVRGDCQFAIGSEKKPQPSLCPSQRSATD